MNFVYICRNGHNEELRYSIRSLYKNIDSPKVWVVGGKPNWYIGNYIRVSQNQSKHVNARNNMKKITTSDQIPDDFILMNDDFFIMQPMDDIPYFHGGKLIDKVNMFKENVPKSAYTKMLSDTYDKLISLNIKNPLDYAIHVPIKINKEKFSNVIYPSYSVRTMYGNIYKVGGKKIKDVKIHQNRKWTESPDHLNENTLFLSSNDNSFETLYNDIFNKEFKSKSPLER